MINVIYFKPRLSVRLPGSFLLPLVLPFFLLGLFLFCPGAQAGSGPVVIIKVDDFRGPNQAWTNFLEVSRRAGIKVSIGVIVESIQGNQGTAEWMKAEAARGDVEFWDHGWDHKQWKDGEKTVSEFGGSGLAHQREHFSRAQAGLKTALGFDVTAFGTPYNAFDTNTVTVVNETPELRMLFTHNLALARKLVNPRVAIVDIIGESDGTAKPNAAKFEADWTKRPTNTEPVSLQFHPPYFDAAHLGEYEKIVNYLKAQGCSIQLPSECARK